MTALPDAPTPLIDRELVQKLSRVAATADRVACLADATSGERAWRKRQLENEAKEELRELKTVLASLPLEG
jgi:hypothetical protein